jgi:hypothetical protein
MKSVHRALLLVLVIAAIPPLAAYYAVTVDGQDLGANECLQGGDLCVGESVGWGLGQILRADGDDIVMTLSGGLEVALVDWESPPDLPVGLVVSIAGTYMGNAQVSVDRYQLHPLRRVKEATGILGLAAWLSGLGLFVYRRARA